MIASISGTPKLWFRYPTSAARPIATRATRSHAVLDLEGSIVLGADVGTVSQELDSGED